MKTIISTLLLSSFVLVSCKTYKNVQEPEFRDIQNVRMIDIGLLKSKAGAELIYYNPNNFNVVLSSARGDVYIDNQYIGRFELENQVSIKKRAEFILPAILKVDNISAIKQHDIYKKKEVLIRIDGVARLTKTGFSKEIPIKYEKLEDTDKLRSLVSR
ncbi:MAG: LEA type 2 family protein [Chitinophagaceae bacterium]|nr:LEA type 2 family protein [Chitinophagaceae bacterium]MBK8605915.1 LEA type 2 family protein [Chitinophagaceae bacterium]MBP6477285.1 LEA type 2 family protein [Chitinophagaceae bacterium]MBP7108925.1 LEA type 2 family protein [Chitinophagaceae bacterium]MBP7314263.1 LEA type 2 family protein [Chitinophagaceae bacterium]